MAMAGFDKQVLPSPFVFPFGVQCGLAREFVPDREGEGKDITSPNHLLPKGTAHVSGKERRRAALPHSPA